MKYVKHYDVSLCADQFAQRNAGEKEKERKIKKNETMETMNEARAHAHTCETVIEAMNWCKTVDAVPWLAILIKAILWRRKILWN